MDSSSDFVLKEALPNVLGTIVIDENNNIVASTGIGLERVEDVVELSRVKLDDSGYGLFQDHDVNCNVYRQDGKTVVVYTAGN
ncbi:hypothetical protein Kpol_1028p35 [Vanderwaltozyma polyspora DSM 70294]|uniref:Late endosomal/lysosomal adaptor and MAPK and MTOR activator 5 n=1 Tax=Vanderwaltozyma polyspora (strain ATCC 22028 / DSM 70294 / BCRC 21397 / CBS 2163 / NBRC 10782 / NRRL Y-8283 / UCD 57-17) TaxID=436907 RepID=A7TG05_VANPO|nr:uncharacterized protein Kpol_1028p35 [Vanderwaltozyma polyspora DSM 70294]EDO18762.1 hypothetical protein Kpol_1028p35 [Vanderwaltozyma polyspora DSM 70294]